ncbi:hypothetical protein [Alkalibacillus haloalkaliphilus]|uniref:hypothetical protein n=1 Tax=Alkalibacillus haloalkaliphilus TaxID=94136 RepID=UPI00293683EF|nr:hypothetical protein [Alkalibacillus haloalkaliphilus]MDV2582799.1 hypothetical protein [Alkalibacillus haloalkaliphilus]
MKWLVFLFFFAMLVGCTSGAKHDLDDVVAEVMGEEVTAEEVYQYRYHRDRTFEQSVILFATYKLRFKIAEEHGFNMTEQEVEEEIENGRESGVFDYFLEENYASFEEGAEILNIGVEEYTLERYKRSIVEGEGSSYLIEEVYCEEVTEEPCPDTTEEFNEKMMDYLQELNEEYIEYQINE